MKRLINLQLEEEDIRKLKELAKDDNRNMSSYLRNLIIEEYKKKHEQNKQEK